MSWNTTTHTHTQCRRCRWHVKHTTLDKRGVCAGPLACRRNKWFDYRHDTLAKKALR